MKIKLDENLPVRLVGVLAQHGHETDTVIDENLAGYTDAAAWHAAVAEQRLVICGAHRSQDTHQTPMTLEVKEAKLAF